MLSQNEIWTGIIHKWATCAQIIQFIETFLDSDYYDNLSNHDQLNYDIFYQTALDELSDHSEPFRPYPTHFVYECIARIFADYGWNLED